MKQSSAAEEGKTTSDVNALLGAEKEPGNHKEARPDSSVHNDDIPMDENKDTNIRTGSKDEEAKADDGKESETGVGEEVKKGKGRRGDPRMHRAVAARLAKPQLSLFQALVAGGFKFPVSEIASKGNGPIYDSDNVLLSQRKNQLSRRLRLLARRRQSHQMALNASATTKEGMTLEKSNKIVSAIEANTNLIFGSYPLHYPQVGHTVGGGAYPGMNAMQQLQMQALLKQQQEMVRSSAAALGLNKFNHQAMLANQLGYPGLVPLPGANMMMNATTNNCTSAAPISPTDPNAISAASNDTSAAPVSPADPNAIPAASTTTSNPEAMYKMRLDQAIEFYRNEKETLKKRALVAAGFKENEIDAVNEDYQRKLVEVDVSLSATKEEAKISDGVVAENGTSGAV